MDEPRIFTAFAGDRLIVSGDLETVLRRTKAAVDGGAERVLVFDDRTGQQVDFELHGTPDEVIAREAPPPPRPGPGRPKLGVISREVSLLPRHWAWLEEQPNGISAALRRLVEAAMKREPGKQRARIARDAASKFMWVMAGNLPGFEEASRALFADDQARFDELVREWPEDIRAHLARLLANARRFESTDALADVPAAEE